MTETDVETVPEYCARRDAAVLSDLDTFIRFSAEQGQNFSRREIAEIAQHKMRTAIVGLPRDVRAASKAWLAEHGYRPWDDGNV